MCGCFALWRIRNLRTRVTSSSYCQKWVHVQKEIEKKKTLINKSSSRLIRIDRNQALQKSILCLRICMAFFFSNAHLILIQSEATIDRLLRAKYKNMLGTHSLKSPDTVQHFFRVCLQAEILSTISHISKHSCSQVRVSAVSSVNCLQRWEHATS